MSQSLYRFPAFVNDLRKITRETADEAELLQQLAPLAQQVALRQNWPRDDTGESGSAEGFIPRLLHLEDDNTLYISVITFLPGCITPVHNHNTWAVVVGVTGLETHTLWELSGQPEPGADFVLSQSDTIRVGRGDVLTLSSQGIHSVENRTRQESVSFHVYGKSLLHTNRCRFWPETNRAERYY